MKTRDRLEWATLIEGPAFKAFGSEGVPLDSTDSKKQTWADAFRDNLGDRRHIDRYLLGHLLSLPVSQADAEHETADLRIWSAVAEARGAEGLPVALPVATEVPAIEVRTEIELASLHGLAWLAERDSRIDLRSSAAWLMAELQPDNATNHPWAIGVFFELWCANADPEALHYAETLMHNCLVGHGVPDRFSALILLDSARWMREQAQPG